MDNTLSIALTGAAVGIITKLLAMWERRQQNARTDSNRRQDRLDRESTAAAMAIAVKKEADRVTHATSEQTAQVIAKLDVNTQLTADTARAANEAYAAGNDMNTKFLKIHSRLDRHDQQLEMLLRR